MAHNSHSTACPDRPPTAPAGDAVRRAGAARLGRASVRFWVCLVLLGSSAVAMRVLPSAFGVFFQKDAVPLKKPLAQFDVRALGPRYERDPFNDKVPPMGEDLIEGLGTHEFLQIYLADTTRARTDTTRLARLFVTYYTGQPDLVPHVPDECFLAGGYDPLGATTRDVHVAGVGAPSDQLPVRQVRFRAPQTRGPAGGEVAVLYFFHANGGYVTTRDGVRMKLTNPFQRFAYYAKIEVTFTGDDLRGNANPDEAAEALAPLMEAVLPVLLNQHFDLERFTAPPTGSVDGRRQD